MYNHCSKLPVKTQYAYLMNRAALRNLYPHFQAEQLRGTWHYVIFLRSKSIRQLKACGVHINYSATTDEIASVLIRLQKTRFPLFIFTQRLTFCPLGSPAGIDGLSILPKTRQRPGRIPPSNIRYLLKLQAHRAEEKLPRRSA